jgi:4a-hydroxytetrahydrobiopterin dehydratase
MKSELANRRCRSCSEGTPPLKGEATTKLKNQPGDNWQAVGRQHLEKDYVFKHFREALDFTNRVGEVAEQEGHHPDIFLGWGTRLIRQALLFILLISTAGCPKTPQVLRGNARHVHRVSAGMEPQLSPGERRQASRHGGIWTRPHVDYLT